ncbi:MAG: glycosyltransferase [Roseibium sp.]
MTEIPSDVTVCITSCGRLDLLQETLSSFRKFNTGGRIILHEDSCDEDVLTKARELFPDIQIIHGDTRRGLMGSIDALYSEVETAYIFHLEDDWAFEGPVNWQAAIQLLSENPQVSNVCVRKFAEIKPKWAERSTELTAADTSFRHMKSDAHAEFFGWSTNPGLISKELYSEFAPFGRVLHDQMSRTIKGAGKTMAFLLPGVASHIGDGRYVTDPTMGPRPKTKLGKLKRSIFKKLYYMGWRSSPF